MYMKSAKTDIYMHPCHNFACKYVLQKCTHWLKRMPRACDNINIFLCRGYKG